MEEVRGAPAGRFEDLEAIRTQAGMSTARLCALIDTAERTWRRCEAMIPAGGQVKGPWPRPARTAATELATKHALAHPA